MNSTYIDNLNLVYEKGAWFGDTWLDKLQDVTEKEAFTRPAKDIHSIAELVAHVIYWRSPLIKKLSGEKDYAGSVDSPDNWPSLDKLKKKGWSTILEEFDNSQKLLLKLVGGAKPEFFESEYSPGNSWSYVTDGIIQHDIYHLGQMGLVKKMVRNS